jgi:DNA-binding response OmpR family regulator
MAREILIVIDEKAMAHWLPRHFEDAGWSVTCTGSETEAMAHLEAGGSPAVAIVDVVLGTCDGYALIQDIRKRLPGLFIICASARAGSVARLKALSAGANAYIAKPFALADLDRLVAGEAQHS